MYWMYALDLISRYLHIACTTVLVGGTLFYEMVMPAAIDELKTEQQLDVFGRARWVFRRLVWISAVLLVLSGAVATRAHWATYRDEPYPPARPPSGMALEGAPSVLRRPGWWWAAHVSTGGLAVLIAVYLTTVARPPDHPIGWMRLNLVILLLVIFLATAARHVRLFNADTNRERVVIPYLPEASP
jgi:peptidoglycan/LPS O-acetylase OafA/YrhL